MQMEIDMRQRSNVAASLRGRAPDSDSSLSGAVPERKIRWANEIVSITLPFIRNSHTWFPLVRLRLSARLVSAQCCQRTQSVSFSPKIMLSTSPSPAPASLPPYPDFAVDLYLDANATTPVLPLAQQAAQQVMAANFGNPSSSHSSGLRARAVLDSAHLVAQQVLGAPEGRVFFTSGATESIQTAVLSALHALAERRNASRTEAEALSRHDNHAGTDQTLGTTTAGASAINLLLYGATEHKAVPEALKHWNKVLGLGCEIVPIPVNSQGLHDLAFLHQHAPHAALVCTMAVNNETGVISELDKISAALEGSNALWLVDSVQALGKQALALATTRIDYASFSGHKLYAPKGIGLLYVRPGAPFTPLMVGGGQESAQRGGTENLPGIAAFAAVLQALQENNPVFHPHAVLAGFRQRLVAAVRQAFPDVVFNAGFEHTVPTTLNFSVPGLSSKEMLDLFDAAGIRVSSGSACNSNKVVKSYVLEAMGLAPWQTSAAVRMSFGPASTEAEITDACQRILQAGQAIHNACLLLGGASSDDHSQTPADGLIRLMYDSACSWIAADHEHRCCVIIDPLPELAERIARWVACRDLQVLAVLATDASHSPCRAALKQLLLARIPAALQDTNALGWPKVSEAPAPGSQQALHLLHLPNGHDAHALQLGASVLLQLPGADLNAAAYLLGQCSNSTLAASDVRFAFIGDRYADPAERAHLAALVSPHTLLLGAHDYSQEFATTLEAETLPASVREEVNLAAQQIGEFLREHPAAWVVDVREAYEHGMGSASLNFPTRNAPLSRLPQYLGEWLQNPQQELLFVCRSGARSALAAACLRRLGHRNSWHLVGGLALQ